MLDFGVVIMSETEIKTVLENWIREALLPEGQIAHGVPPSDWIAEQFLSWWKSQTEESLSEAVWASSQIRDELVRLGGWKKCGEALEAVCHLNEALTDLAGNLGVEIEQDG